eukprot:CAMPEP_0181450766 /NCGR_PEP_ID=MMETSP1110-20121109/28344_1 /TAXON_ID=174948 /ORGANISM="Symbiodinium sp., Strain CCMP421" /LENGTH=159 /DNA_ID=CAMNT_0023574995 /DNA_START=760 /DNA_END=1239 /DNA_ORIENTATION=+
MAEEFFGVAHKLAMVYRSSSCNDDSICKVVRLNVCSQLLSGYRLDVLNRSQDCVAQRAVVEGCEMQTVKNDLLGCFLHFFHLSKDDAPFELQMCLVQRGMLQDVCEDVHTIAQVGLEALGIVHRLLSGGVRIQVPPHVFDLLLQLNSVSPLCAFEGHVL